MEYNGMVPAAWDAFQGQQMLWFLRVTDSHIAGAPRMMPKTFGTPTVTSWMKTAWAPGAMALWRCGAVALRTVVIQCHYKSQVCLLSLSENWLPKIRFMKFFPIKSMRKRCGMVRYNLPNTDIPQGGANSAKSLQRMQITKPRRDMGKGIYLGGRKTLSTYLDPQKIPELNIKHGPWQNVEVHGWSPFSGYGQAWSSCTGVYGYLTIMGFHGMMGA